MKSNLAKTSASISPTLLTFYGYPDNDPPSAEIAYDCGRGYTANGTGTFANPLTAASAPGEFDKCEVLYIPYLRKHVIIEDTCAKCIVNWKSKQYHVDVWLGPAVHDDKVVACENTLTPKSGVTVIPVRAAASKVDDGICNVRDTYPDEPDPGARETNDPPNQEDETDRSDGMDDTDDTDDSGNGSGSNSGSRSSSDRDRAESSASASTAKNFWCLSLIIWLWMWMWIWIGM